MKDINNKTTIRDIELSHFDPLDVQIDAILSNYNPIIKRPTQDKKIVNTINGINTKFKETYNIDGKDVTALEFYSEIKRRASKLAEEYYDFKEEKFKDDTPPEVLKEYYDYYNKLTSEKLQKDATDEEIIKGVELKDSIVADKWLKLPKHALAATVGGFLGAATDASEDGFFGIGRHTNRLVDVLIPDSVPYLGKWTKYNPEEWDSFHSDMKDYREKFLDYISPTKENKREYERSYELGRLFAPLSPTAKLRTGTQAIKGITNPKLLKTINYGLNGTGMLIGSTTPGMDFDGVKGYVTQLPLNLGLFETNAYASDKKGLFNDYTKPIDRIVESVLFTNVGNHKKDKSYKLAITKKGEKLYRDFIINEVEKNRNAYEEAKSNFEDSLLGTTATIGGVIFNKKYNIKGKVFNLWQKGKNKTLDKLNNQYLANLSKNKYVNFEKIDRLYDMLSPSMKLRSTMVDRYAVLDEMINRKMLNKSDLPFFYNDKSVIKDAMYETGVISKTIKLKTAPKVTESLMLQLKNENPRLFSQFDDFLNQYTKLNFAKRNGLDVKELINTDKYKDFKKLYKTMKNTPITRELMEQISEQNKAIQRMFNHGKLDDYADDSRLLLNKDLIYAYDEPTIIEKILNDKQPIDIDPQFFRDNDIYKPIDEVYKSRLYNAADKFIQNEQKKQFIAARNKSFSQYVNDLKRGVRKTAFEMNLNIKKGEGVSPDNDTIMDTISLKMQENLAKQYNVRLVGEIDLSSPTKVINSKSDVEFLDKVDAELSMYPWIKKNYTDHIEKVRNVFQPSTEKALKFLEKNKNNNNVLTVIEGNKLRVYRTDEMIGAMFNHNPDTLSLVGRFNRSLKKLQEKMTTGRLNPLFSVKSNAYTIEEAATALTNIVDEVAKDIGVHDLVRKYSTVDDIVKDGFKPITENSKNVDYLIDDSNLVVKSDQELINDKIKELKISTKEYILETFKASKELIRQRKAADLVNNQARLLGRALINGDVSNVDELKHELSNLQKQYNDFLSTRIQLSGYASKSPYTQIDTNLVDVSNINPKTLKNLPKNVVNYVDFLQTVIRESPVLGLTTYLGKKLGYINKNGKIIDKQRMEALTKSISRNTSNSNVKGNYLKLSGKIGKTVANHFQYGEVYLKSLAAKAHNTGIGKFIDNAIQDVGVLLDKNTTYDEFFDLVGQQLSTVKDNKGLKRTLGYWGVIGLSNYVWNHASNDNIEAYYSIPEYERANNIILVNAGGKGVHLKLPVDQEFGIINQWSHLTADNLLNFSELNDVDPAFEQPNQLRKSLGRSLFPGGVPLVDAGLAIAGLQSDINILSDFGGIKSLGRNNPNPDKGDTRYAGGVMDVYTQNVIETFFTNYGSIFVSAVEEGNASLKSDTALKDVGKVLVDKFTTPVSITTSKISRYTQTNNYNYEYSTMIDKNNQVKTEFTPHQAFAHEIVSNFRKNRISKLEEIRDIANYEKKKQIANGNKQIFLDYEGRKTRINDIDTFINRINSRIYREYQTLDNTLSYIIEDNYGITGVNVLNYKEKLLEVE